MHTNGQARAIFVHAYACMDVHESLLLSLNPLPLPLQSSYLKTSLPPNVHLLTLKLEEVATDHYTLLVRLEHQCEMDEAPWNEAANVSLAVSDHASPYDRHLSHLVQNLHGVAGVYCHNFIVGFRTL